MECDGAEQAVSHWLFEETDDGRCFATRKARSVQHQSTAYVGNALLKSQRAEIDALKQQLLDRRDALIRRRARLQSARRMLKVDILELQRAEPAQSTAAADAEEEEELHKVKQPRRSTGCHTMRSVVIPELTEQLQQIRQKVHVRRKELLYSLEQIYPIDVVNPACLLFGIAGVPLPNLSDSTLDGAEQAIDDPAERKKLKALEKDDDTISSALGLAAQLVLLLSDYLGTPLHYNIATAGSRAVIHDAISAINGPRV